PGNYRAGSAVAARSPFRTVVQRASCHRCADQLHRRDLRLLPARPPPQILMFSTCFSMGQQELLEVFVSGPYRQRKFWLFQISSKSVGEGRAAANCFLPNGPKLCRMGSSKNKTL